jgi:predicted RNA binding protein YcfA (HicA-like mRNA interferase family)
VKLPRDLSGQRVVKGLNRLGFEVEKQKGSHIRLSDGNRRITVPNHSALLPKTLQSVLKQAGITIKDLMDAL